MQQEKMTERARIREEYKKKKRFPAPEISKSVRKVKKKHFIIEERLTEEGYKNECQLYKKSDWQWRDYPDRKWHKCYGKYEKRKDAENALAALEKLKLPSNRKFHDFIVRYDYRIVESKR